MTHRPAAAKQNKIAYEQQEETRKQERTRKQEKNKRNKKQDALCRAENYVALEAVLESRG